MWPFSKPKTFPEQLQEVKEHIDDLDRRLRGLERDQDDLHDYVRTTFGKIAKRIKRAAEEPGEDVDMVPGGDVLPVAGHAGLTAHQVQKNREILARRHSHLVQRNGE